MILLTSSQVGYELADHITLDLMCYDSICGDFLKEGAEACDNGNATGCINCAADPLYNCDGTNNTGLTCLCGNPLFYWKISERICAINCSAIANAHGLLTGSSNQCMCNSGFIFDPVVYNCYINCSAVPNAIALVTGSLDQCTCNAGYYYDSNGQKCVLNCSSIANAAGYNLNRDLDKCACRSNYVWDASTSTCKLDCGSFSNAAGTVSSDECICANGYLWVDFPKGCNAVSKDPVIIDISVALVLVGTITASLFIITCKIWKANSAGIF